MNVQWLKIMILVSLYTTLAFAIIKVIFYTASINDWMHQHTIVSSVVGSCIYTFSVLAYKVWKYIPRYKHLKEVQDDKQIIDLKLIKRLITLSIVIIVLFSFMFLADVNTLTHAAIHESYVLMGGAILAVITSTITLGITTAILVLAKRTRGHYQDGSLPAQKPIE